MIFGKDRPKARRNAIAFAVLAVVAIAMSIYASEVAIAVFIACGIAVLLAALASLSHRLRRRTAELVVATELKDHAQSQVAELRAALDAAEKPSRAKGEFLASMSEEIRTPMNGIIGQTDLTLGTDLAPTHREAGPHLSVLVVEDHPVNQLLARALLEHWGHATTMAENGAVALERMAERAFDLVLMDLRMPVMDGIETARRMRERERADGGSRVPIIAMTASAMSSDRDVCLAAGMDGFLAKPVEVEALYRAIIAHTGGVARRVPRADLADSGRLTVVAMAPGESPAEPHAADAIDDSVPAAPATDVPALASVQASGIRPPAGFDYRQSLAESNPELIGMIGKSALDQYPLDLAQLRRQLVERDGPGAARTVHSMSGTLGLFKARPAVASARALDKLAREGRVEDALAELRCLEVEVGGLAQALRDFLK